MGSGKPSKADELAGQRPGCQAGPWEPQPEAEWGPLSTALHPALGRGWSVSLHWGTGRADCCARLDRK